MAGEWLKFDCSLPEKPEVLAITAAMGWDDPDLTVGKLMRVFRWFDQHTVDGNARGVTPALLDRVVGVAGIAEAMASVCWLVVEQAGVSLANFDRHNGATAKSRAQTAKRVANHRGNAPSNAASVTEALAREEKRREEEEKKEHDAGASLAAKPSRPVRKCPESFTVTDDLLDWAKGKAADVSLDDETAKFRDHTFKTAISDWDGAWRNWMRNAQKFHDERPPSRRGNGAATGETPWQRSQRERVAEMSGGLVSAKPPGRHAEIETFDMGESDVRVIAAGH